MGSEQLSDAVQTIQPEQYEQIAATLKPVLIVQGAAGSGKSLVGLHRIDFILSPFSNVGNLGRPTAERVIMFGPSAAFLEYVSDLLPSLGVRRVRQTTVSRWLLSQFTSRVTLRRGDRIFDDLMNNRRKLTGAEIEAHLFKAGLGATDSLGRTAPLTPCVHVARGFVTGDLGMSHVLSMVYIIALTAVVIPIASVFLNRRLIK